MVTKIPNMQDLLEAGVHFGHQVRRGNPKMKPYIYGARDGVHIIDLSFSEAKLKEAAEAAYELGKKGKVLLIVGTKKQAKDIVEELAREVDTPYLTSHWLGGLLTNFSEIRKNLKKLIDLREEQTKGTLSRYTKKEQLLIQRKLTKNTFQFGGIANMEQMPDALFLIDTMATVAAVKEAQRMDITLIGFSDTNSNPTWLDFPIPANDDGIKSIKIIAETIIRSYGEGKKAAGVQAAKKLALEKKDEAVTEQLDGAVAEETAVLEEQVEKEIVEESSRKEGQ